MLLSRDMMDVDGSGSMGETYSSPRRLSIDTGNLALTPTNSSSSSAAIALVSSSISSSFSSSSSSIPNIFATSSTSFPSSASSLSLNPSSSSSSCSFTTVPLTIPTPAPSITKSTELVHVNHRIIEKCQHSGGYSSQKYSSNQSRKSFWNMKCSCCFSLLPDEVLMFDIFTYLDTRDLCKFQRVCKRWQWLCQDGYLWRKVDFSHLGRRATEPIVLDLLQKYGKFVDSLKLCDNRRLPQSLLLQVGELTSQLRELHLCNVIHADDEVIMKIVKVHDVTNLVDLSLLGCKQVTNAAVLALLRKAVNLEDLVLRGCINLDASIFTGLSGSMPALRKVNVAGNVKTNVLQLVQTLQKVCPALESLTLHGLKNTDAAIEVVSLAFPNLHTLVVSSSNPFGMGSQLTDVSLIHIRKLTNLKVFNAEGCGNFSASALKALVTSCTRLQSLNISGIRAVNDDVMEHIFRALPDLVHLKVALCMNVTDKCLAAACNCRSIASSSSSSSSQRSMSMQVEENAPCRLKLETLDMHGCLALTPRLVSTLVNCTGLRATLEVLDLSECELIRRPDVDDLKSRIHSKKLQVVHY